MSAGKNSLPNAVAFHLRVPCAVFAAAAIVLSLQAQEPDGIQAAVVKIMDTPRPGTGVVVAFEQGVATVLTASHVIQGATK